MEIGREGGMLDGSREGGKKEMSVIDNFKV